MSAAHPLRTLRDQSLDGIAINDYQRRLAANPSPERDSLFEDLMWLREKYAISDEDALPALRRLRELIEWNDRELPVHQTAVRISDDLLRAERNARRHPQLADSAPSIKRLAETLRPALLILRDPAGYTGSDLTKARRTVIDIVRRTPVDRLACSSLRNQLRGRSHDTLMQFVQKREAA